MVGSRKRPNTIDTLQLGDILNATAKAIEMIAKIKGNTHQYFITKRFMTDINPDLSVFMLFPIAFNYVRTVFTEQVGQCQIAFLVSVCVEP